MKISEREIKVLHVGLIFILSLMLYSCGRHQDDSSQIVNNPDSVTTESSTLASEFQKLLSDTVNFSRSELVDKYNSPVIIWSKNAVFRIAQLHRIPNAEGVEETARDFLFFDSTGMLYAFRVPDGDFFVTEDSVFHEDNAVFFQSAIYGRTIKQAAVDPILNAYKYQSLRFLEISSAANSNFKFSANAFQTEFECEPRRNVPAYTTANAGTGHITLKAGDICYFTGITHDESGLSWIEIRIPTPDPVDDESFYIKAVDFFANVDY